MVMQSRMFRAALFLVAGALLFLPAAASAHVGDGGPIQTVTQAVGPYELAVTFELPPAVPAPLFVSIAAREDLGGARFSLRAAPRGGALADAEVVEVATVPGTPLVYKAQLALDRPGAWDLELRAEGPLGAGVTRIPFTVTPVPLPAYTVPLLVSLGGLFVLMLAGVLVAAVAQGRGRAPLRRLSWAIGQSAFGFGIAAAIFGGLQISESFRSASQTSAGTVASGRPHINMALSSEPAEPVAGHAALLTLELSDGGTGLAVDDLSPHHEALLHLVLVDASGRDFHHLHPARIDAGRFQINWTPQVAGPYTAYAEVARHDSGTQVVARSFVVGGATGGLMAAPPGLGSRDIGDLTVDVRAAGELHAGRQAVLTLNVSADGTPVRDIEPWLGMAGHLIARSTDGTIFSHVHAAEAAPLPGTLGSGMRYGPEIRFVYTFPVPGTYQLWAQFQHGGQIVTVPLLVEVPA
jgi:hypothetical protein